MPDGVSELLPATERAWFRKFFGVWLRRQVPKHFHAVRLVRGSAEVLGTMSQHAGPVILLSNHHSWWDPLVAFIVHERWFAVRPALSPMDVTQLRKFKFFRKLGVFGVDPDHAAGLRSLVRYVGDRFAAAPRSVLMITPQGQFVDPRLAISIRPGVAMLAARHPEARVLSVSVEYAFWNDQRPEVFLRAVPIEPPNDPSDARAWHTNCERAMNDNAAELARCVQTRDAAEFVAVTGGGAAQIHPLYDLILRATGRATSIETAHREGGAR